MLQLRGATCATDGSENYNQSIAGTDTRLKPRKVVTTFEVYNILAITDMSKEIKMSFQ